MDLDTNLNEKLLPDTEEEVMNIDQAISKTGGCGRFQIFASLLLIFAFIMGGFVTFSLPLLNLQPDYLCDFDATSTHEPTWTKCSYEEACSGLYPRMPDW